MPTEPVSITGQAYWRHHEMYISTIFGEPYRMTFYRALIASVNGVEKSMGRDDKPFQYTSADLPNIKFLDENGVERDGVWLAENIRRAVDAEIQKRVDTEAGPQTPPQP